MDAHTAQLLSNLSVMTHTWAVTDRYTRVGYTNMRDMLAACSVTGDIVAEIFKRLWVESELQHHGIVIGPNFGRLSHSQRITNVENAFRGISNVADGYKMKSSSGLYDIELVAKNDAGELVHGGPRPRLGEDDLCSIYLRFLGIILRDDDSKLSRLRELCNGSGIRASSKSHD